MLPGIGWERWKANSSEQESLGREQRRDFLGFIIKKSSSSGGLSRALAAAKCPVPRVALSFVTRHLLAALTESYNSRASQHQRNSNYGGFKNLSGCWFCILQVCKSIRSNHRFLHSPRGLSSQFPVCSCWNLEFQLGFLLEPPNLAANLTQGQQHPISEILPPKQFLGKLPPAAPLLHPPIGRGDTKEEPGILTPSKNSWISNPWLWIPGSGVGLKS